MDNDDINETPASTNPEDRDADRDPKATSAKASSGLVDAHGHAISSGDGGDGGDGADQAIDGELFGVLAEFDTPGELVEAARKVRDAGYTEFDCYSPFPVHGIDEAMGIKRTILPALVFCGGVTGTIGGILLQWYCNASAWHWNVSGKPIWSIPANIPIAFETTILLSVFTTFFGMWTLNKLPQVWHPFFRLDRFSRVTDDGFFLGIEAKDKRYDERETRRLLDSAGALAIEECHLDGRPEARTMPKWIFGMIIATTVFALVPFALIAKARASHSKDPHWHIFADMDFQPKAKSDGYFELFADGRANRGDIPGTVARGWLQEDDAYNRGLDAATGGAWITNFPAQVDVSIDTVKRGQNRFNIYCSPCHGYDGRGMGAVPTRLQKQLGQTWSVRNLIDPALAPVTMPNGQLFNTISNGYNTMMGYAAQIPVADRWAIVTYVRALQRSQNASENDVPVDHRGDVR